MKRNDIYDVSNVSRNYSSFNVICSDQPCSILKPSFLIQKGNRKFIIQPPSPPSLDIKEFFGDPIKLNRELHGISREVPLHLSSLYLGKDNKYSKPTKDKVTRSFLNSYNQLIKVYSLSSFDDKSLHNTKVPCSTLSSPKYILPTSDVDESESAIQSLVDKESVTGIIRKSLKENVSSELQSYNSKSEIISDSKKLFRTYGRCSNQNMNRDPFLKKLEKRLTKSPKSLRTVPQKKIIQNNFQVSERSSVHGRGSDIVKKRKSKPNLEMTLPKKKISISEYLSRKKSETNSNTESLSLKNGAKNRIGSNDYDGFSSNGMLLIRDEKLSGAESFLSSGIECSPLLYPNSFANLSRNEKVVEVGTAYNQVHEKHGNGRSQSIPGSSHGDFAASFRYNRGSTNVSSRGATGRTIHSFSPKYGPTQGNNWSLLVSSDGYFPGLYKDRNNFSFEENGPRGINPSDDSWAYRNENIDSSWVPWMKMQRGLSFPYFGESAEGFCPSGQPFEMEYSGDLDCLLYPPQHGGPLRPNFRHRNTSKSRLSTLRFPSHPNRPRGRNRSSSAGHPHGFYNPYGDGLLGPYPNAPQFPSEPAAWPPSLLPNFSHNNWWNYSSHDPTITEHQVRKVSTNSDPRLADASRPILPTVSSLKQQPINVTVNVPEETLEQDRVGQSDEAVSLLSLPRPDLSEGKRAKEDVGRSLFYPKGKDAVLCRYCNQRNLKFTNECRLCGKSLHSAAKNGKSIAELGEESLLKKVKEKIIELSANTSRTTIHLPGTSRLRNRVPEDSLKPRTLSTSENDAMNDTDDVILIQDEDAKLNDDNSKHNLASNEQNKTGVSNNFELGRNKATYLERKGEIYDSQPEKVFTGNSTMVSSSLDDGGERAAHSHRKEDTGLCLFSPPEEIVVEKTLVEEENPSSLSISTQSFYSSAPKSSLSETDSSKKVQNEPELFVIISSDDEMVTPTLEKKELSKESTVAASSSLEGPTKDSQLSSGRNSGGLTCSMSKLSSRNDEFSRSGKCGETRSPRADRRKVRKRQSRSSFSESSSRDSSPKRSSKSSVKKKKKYRKRKRNSSPHGKKKYSRRRRKSSRGRLSRSYSSESEWSSGESSGNKSMDNDDEDIRDRNSGKKHETDKALQEKSNLDGLPSSKLRKKSLKNEKSSLLTSDADLNSLRPTVKSAFSPIRSSSYGSKAKIPIRIKINKQSLTGYHNNELYDPGNISDASDGKFVMLSFANIFIGSYMVPCKEKESVRVSAKSIVLVVPPILQGESNVYIVLKRHGILKISVHLTKDFFVLILYLKPSVGSYVRRLLKMADNTGPYFDPVGSDGSIRRMVITSTGVSSSQRYFLNLYLRNGFQPVLSVISREAADALLLKSFSGRKASVRDSSRLKSNKLFVYPPDSKLGGIPLTVDDYCCLEEGQYLNDVIIDFYLKWIMLNKLSEVDRERTYVFSTFFYKRLTSKPVQGMRLPAGEEEPFSTPAQKRHLRVKSWTKNVDLFSKDFVFIPINEHSHWFLAVICFPGLVDKTVLKKKSALTVWSKKSKGFSTQSNVFPEEELLSDRDEATGDDAELEEYESDASSSRSSDSRSNAALHPRTPGNRVEAVNQPCILVFDSLPGSLHSNVVSTLRDYLSEEHSSRKGYTKTFSKYTIPGACPSVPRQTNLTDCGLFILQYAESFFEKPLKSFIFPLKSLRNWIDVSVINDMREYIAKLIQDLVSEHNPSVALPNLHFNSLNNFDGEEVRLRNDSGSSVGSGIDVRKVGKSRENRRNALRKRRQAGDSKSAFRRSKRALKLSNDASPTWQQTLEEESRIIGPREEVADGDPFTSYVVSPPRSPCEVGSSFYLTKDTTNLPVPSKTSRQATRGRAEKEFGLSRKSRLSKNPVEKSSSLWSYLQMDLNRENESNSEDHHATQYNPLPPSSSTTLTKTRASAKAERGPPRQEVKARSKASTKRGSLSWETQKPTSLGFAALNSLKTYGSKSAGISPRNSDSNDSLFNDGDSGHHSSD